MTTENSVLNYLQTVQDAKTIREIAAYLSVHQMTVRYALSNLEESGQVVKGPKRGKSFTYLPAHGTNRGGANIVWKGAAVPIGELLHTWATDISSRPKGKDYNVIAFQALTLLYKLAIESLDEEDPTVITITRLREIRMQLIQFADQLKSNLITLESLINNDNLFTPRDLPLTLILKEELFNPGQIKAMLEEIEKPQPPAQ